MVNFILFAFYLAISAAMLIIWPIMLHPTLPVQRKILFSVLTFILLVPLGFALYAWLGVPQLAGK